VGVVQYMQAVDIGESEHYTHIFTVQAASPNQRVTLQVLDYSPQTNVERLTIYNSDLAKYVPFGLYDFRVRPLIWTYRQTIEVSFKYYSSK